MQVISRDQAAAAGMKKYYTGSACAHGHIAERWVSNWQCVDCRREQAREAARKRRAENHDAHRVVNRRYWAKKSAEINEKRKGIYAAAPEQIRERERERYHANREVRLSKVSEYREANRQVIKLKGREYYARNATTRKALSSLQRARRKQADGEFTKNDIHRLEVMQRNRCAVCGKKMRKYHIDHIKPLAKGGTNDPTNLQLLCPNCNQRKSDKDPIEFMQQQGFLL